MPETMTARLAPVTPAMIQATIRREAGDERPQALDAARLAIMLCDRVGIDQHDPDRAQAYELARASIRAAVQDLPGMRYVTGMT